MKQLKDFRDIHTGQSIIVCGLGESLNDLAQPENFITIGVNDIGRKFDPDYLVLLDERESFTDERWHYIAKSKAEYLFTQLGHMWAIIPRPRPEIVKFKLGRSGGTDLSSDEFLPYTNNSPYVALCLAAFMGASRIGLIGVDFAENHFFEKDGEHKLNKQLKRINGEYFRLYTALSARGVRVVNLSARSRLTAFPKMSVEEFANA